MKTHRNQQGTTVVEFAIVSAVFFAVLFALIDFSRLFWNMAALDEATRRGARVAAVCPIDDPAIVQTALFSGLVPNLGAEHIRVAYLNTAGNEVDPMTAAGYGSIHFVRVGIQNFQLRTFIPGVSSVISTPEFNTTIPSESLGRVGTINVNC